MFIEMILPSGVLSPLLDETMNEYRRPFEIPGESRRRTLTCARQIPIDDDLKDVAKVVRGYANWLADSKVPVSGRHSIQEDAGPDIGGAITRRLQSDNR